MREIKNVNIYLTAAKELAVPAEGILSQWFGQSISNLVEGADGEDLDETLPYVLTKVMVARVDVFGARTELGQTSEFEGTGVILKNFAINDGLVANNLVSTLAHLLEQFHDWNHVAEGSAKSDVFGLGGGEGDLRL